MKKSSKGYIPAEGFLTQTVKASAEFNREEMPLFDIHEYCPLIDSSDMSPMHWQQIADDIKAKYADYDGFVVLHGTDTMAFTASVSSASDTLDTNGDGSFTVGGTLTVAADQAAGDYTGTYDATVAYN